MPIDMLVAPTVLVPSTAAGSPVNEPTASAMNAAPPSCRVAITLIPAAGNASSNSRKLSPGTMNAQRTPAAASASAMSRPTVLPPRRVTRCLVPEAQGAENQAHDHDDRDE